MFYIEPILAVAWFGPLLALLLAGGGAAAGMAGQKRAQDKMNQKTLQELARQKDIQGRANQQFAMSLQGSGQDVAQRQIGEGEQERSEGYRQAQQVPMSAGGNQVVGGNNPVLNMQDQVQMSAMNKNRAKLGAYDKWQLDQMVKNLRVGQNMQLYGQEAQRSQAVLPLELQHAGRAGDNLKALGMGLNTASMLVGLGGLGAGAAAGTTTATPAMTAAMQAGYGPVSAQTAASLYGMTAPIAAQNAARAASIAGTFGNVYNTSGW